ncbi:hypothetical protein TNIN_132011, partial [Trichonephila inaurata madagascariensis]
KVDPSWKTEQCILLASTGSGLTFPNQGLLIRTDDGQGRVLLPEPFYGDKWQLQERRR